MFHVKHCSKALYLVQKPRRKNACEELVIIDFNKAIKMEMIKKLLYNIMVI